jgi:hypothetical protein
VPFGFSGREWAENILEVRFKPLTLFLNVVLKYSEYNDTSKNYFIF